jgi:radical SAM superfamily enzyme YgiQ (UPF0313 family)
MPVLLISPPFTQLNSPYASLPFLQGTLKANGIKTSCLDLGINISGRLFSKNGLELLGSFDRSEEYLNTIEPVMIYLKKNNKELAKAFLSKKFLPPGKMLKTALDRNIAGLDDDEYAKYLCSLYLEDVFLLYQKICPDYGLSRYGEKISVSPPVFGGIYKNIMSENDLINRIMEDEIDKAELEHFSIIAFTIPFPGTLIGALKAAKYIKINYPGKIIVFGGGYINTELRSLTDTGIFEFTDFICLDDGEVPLLKLVEFAHGKITKDQLVRTYGLEDGKVKFYDNSDQTAEFKRGTPDYSDIDMDDYIPVLESVNPMMRLWSEKNTLKLRIAKGCYWHRCAFCDTTLPYIKDYAPENTDDLIADISKMVDKTGLNRFHFVDEAIPPAVAIRLSLALIRHSMKITWWGNIRFDKAFTEDVCMLLKHAGCIAAVGGLESACGKTLSSMNKGVTVEDAVGVMKNFKSAGILVHAYMIYGFPTETDGDLIDSTEVLRQLFSAGMVDSAYWHRFALTVHSPVFRDREKYGISVPDPVPKPFANNDVSYIDNSANQPDRYGEGLRKAAYNFMLGIGIDNDINSWFGIPSPKPAVKKRFVRKILERSLELPDMSKRIVWIGHEVRLKGKIISADGINGRVEYELPHKIAAWLKKLLESSSVYSSDGIKMSEAAETFPCNQGVRFESFIANEIWDDLFEAGLLIV